MNFDQQINLENEKLKIKLRYLEDFIENMQNFERSNQLLDLKQFASKNYQRFSMILDEVYSLKSQLEIQKLQHMSDLERMTTEVNQLKATILSHQQIEYSAEPYGQYNTLSKEQAREQIDNTIKQLSDEVEELTTLNSKLREQLKKKDFFREYELMCKETEGLRQQNMRLSEQLKPFIKQPPVVAGNINNNH